MNTADTIIFLHIPKTAGTTLNQIMRRQYSADTSFFLGANAQASIASYRSLPEAKKKRIRLVAGHTAYGFHRYVPGSATYFTFLREPIERVVSFYYYVKHSEQHYLNSAVAQEYRSIGAFVSSGITKMVDNGQTRMLSGAWLEPAFGAVDQRMFAQARAHIEGQFALAGLTEQFDASLVLLRHAFGWQNLFYTRENVGQMAKENRTFSGEERTLVKQHNRWDIALYEFVKDRFGEQITSLGGDFEQELQDFRRGNANYHPQIGVVQRARHWASKFSLRGMAKDLLAK